MLVNWRAPLRIVCRLRGRHAWRNASELGSPHEWRCRTCGGWTTSGWRTGVGYVAPAPTDPPREWWWIGGDPDERAVTAFAIAGCVLLVVLLVAQRCVEGVR